MSDLKIKGEKIVLFGRELTLVFNMNVMDLVSDTYPTVEDMAGALDTPAGQKKILAALANDAIEEHNECYPDDKLEQVSERFIGKQFKATELNKISNLIVRVFRLSVPQSDMETEIDFMGEQKAE